MCQRDLEHTEGKTLISSSAGSGLKEAGRRLLSLHRSQWLCAVVSPESGAELLPFLLGHPRVEALSLKVEVAITPKGGDKTGLCFLNIPVNFQGLVLASVTLLHLTCVLSMVHQETIAERCGH